MMLSRNLLSHTYDIKKFEAILEKIENEYLKELETLHEYLSEKVNNV